jgi:hypothetical protein
MLYGFVCDYQHFHCYQNLSLYTLKENIVIWDLWTNGEWKKLHKEGSCDLYSFPTVVSSVVSIDNSRST